MRGSTTDLKNLVENGNPGLVGAPCIGNLKYRKAVQHENSENTGAGSRWWDASPSSSCVPTCGEQAPAETRVSVDHSPLRLHTLPFSVGQVLDYFNEAFGKRPFKIDDKSFVYTDRGNPDEAATITVSDLEASLGVVLLATGDYGVNYIREFFEAPFFLRAESEQLYILLDGGLAFDRSLSSDSTFKCALFPRREDGSSSHWSSARPNSTDLS